METVTERWALSIIKPIVKSIDGEIEVKIKGEDQREAFTVQLSKEGITTCLSVAWEDLINAQTSPKELEERILEALENIKRYREYELMVEGTLGIIRPLLCNFAVEKGLSTKPSSDRPDFSYGDWDFASFRIDKQDAEGRWHSLGTIRLQGLPKWKTLVTFIRTTWGELSPKEYQVQFEDFCNSFIDRLEQLGFIEKPPPSKEPLGFRKPTGQL
jgi:hypothetical protein